ncbi:MAG: fumarylacetoacetate hydrolase family protein [Pirellula sp.]|jgi:2-keto-4-pentenoate hydratase/2-oxohepta-3-ene-1,7-dioic acid hydratase in catechol pathway|nr:fumarylacetoacetate hydrolase family protein [Pirellula sp.]
MRLVRFARPDESIGWGLQVQYGIQDLTLADPTLPLSTVELIAKWKTYLPRIASLAKKLGTSEQPLRVLCPIDTPRKILCIGLNYRDHAIETKAPIPDEPIVFCKMPTAMVGPDEPILLPRVSSEVDYEAELVLVIGHPMKSVSEEDAVAGIFGYSVGHDVSARDWQKGKPGKQWFLGKSFDTFAPLGPAIVTADEVSDTSNLRIQCRINGETLQDSTTKELIFKPAQLVSYISQVMTLDAGDVIYTGTPPGVGMARTPPRFLKDGDIVEIEIESVGLLSNPVVQER